ncbi:MAG: aminotransferase class V-fold PLP-dependent enzyme [Candidatus Kapabacteria bacterium]|nr:aminotransferase class V-fold PLP-dependent enzyme [Candidatus Kapabacteria bacterium]
MEEYFNFFRNNIIGINQTFTSPFGEKKLIYTDWTASGRLYGPIEEFISKKLGPFVGNTHSETTITGTTMTEAYHLAKIEIKRHVNAGKDDVIICDGSGMTGVINKFQRILGLRLHESFKPKINISSSDKPIIFISSMEHHSNQTSWLETIADVEIIGLDREGLTDLNYFYDLVKKYKERKLKIAAITSCSNVTGIFTPYKEIAKIIHSFDGYCFVDFAASAPYIDIDMHPNEEGAYLDAIFFSPHKFLGGPGSSGVLIFNSKLYKNNVPDNPGGGTVEWTNPWGEHKFVDDIEAREDGGTPPFLQTIKAALAIKLKEQMGTENIKKREEEILNLVWAKLPNIPNIKILADNIRNRLPIFSFYFDEIHYNFLVRLLNDVYGIQSRGGCSCAGTYGHILLNVDIMKSKKITEKIDLGDSSIKPGWVRISFHPTNTNEEIEYVINSIEEISKEYKKYESYYQRRPFSNDYDFIGKEQANFSIVNNLFAAWNK